MGTLFRPWKKVMVRAGDWSKEQINKAEQSGEATFMLTRRHEIQRTNGSEGQAVWQGAPFRGAVKDYVLGGVFCYQGQQEEVAARI